MSNIRFLDLVISLLMGCGLGFVVFASWTEMPEFKLWKVIDFSIPNLFFPISFFDFVHLLLGVSIFVYGMYTVVEIVRVNQRVQAGKNNPIRLLTEGFYSTVRHPMTGMFIVILFGFMFSLGSALSLVIIILFALFFHGATLYEENTWLIPKFGQEYLSYMKNVPRRYLPKVETTILIILFGFSIIGLVL